MKCITQCQPHYVYKLHTVQYTHVVSVTNNNNELQCLVFLITDKYMYSICTLHNAKGQKPLMPIPINTYEHTAKTEYRKFGIIIPRKGIARPQAQFPHLCVCERFICSHDRSAYSAAGKYVDRSLTDICQWKLGLRPSNSFSGNT